MLCPPISILQSFCFPMQKFFNRIDCIVWDAKCDNFFLGHEMNDTQRAYQFVIKCLRMFIHFFFL